MTGKMMNIWASKLQNKLILLSYVVLIIGFLILVTISPNYGIRAVAKSFVVTFIGSGLFMVIFSGNLSFKKFWILYLAHTIVSLCILGGLYFTLFGAEHEVAQIAYVLWRRVRLYFYVTIVLCVILSVANQYHQNRKKRESNYLQS